MILTITMNPSINMAYPLAGALKVDDVNRVEPIKTVDGKGLNVTRVLGQLGDDVVATGLLGGRTGDFIAGRMDKDGVSHDFALIFGENRVRIAALHEGNQTESLEASPAVSADEKPHLVKPNLSELGGLLGREFEHGDLGAVKAATKGDGRFDGVEWVVVSIGAANSAAFSGGRVFRTVAPRIDCVNATGSGDSTIAGFAHGIAADAELAEILRLGNTCDTLNAMGPKTVHLP